MSCVKTLFDLHVKKQEGKRNLNGVWWKHRKRVIWMFQMRLTIFFPIVVKTKTILSDFLFVAADVNIKCLVL